MKIDSSCLGSEPRFCVPNRTRVFANRSPILKFVEKLIVCYVASRVTCIMHGYIPIQGSGFNQSCFFRSIV